MCLYLTDSVFGVGHAIEVDLIHIVTPSVALGKQTMYKLIHVGDGSAVDHCTPIDMERLSTEAVGIALPIVHRKIVPQNVLESQMTTSSVQTTCYQLKNSLKSEMKWKLPQSLGQDDLGSCALDGLCHAIQTLGRGHENKIDLLRAGQCKAQGQNYLQKQGIG